MSKFIRLLFIFLLTTHNAVAVEEPYLYFGLEDAVTDLARENSLSPGSVSHILPSSYYTNLRKIVLRRFTGGFSTKPDIIPPHPRAFDVGGRSNLFPKNYVSALVQYLFPAATPELLIPNTLHNDPVSNLSPAKIGQLIRLVDDAVESYIPAAPLRWRIDTEKKLYDILGRTWASKVENVDTDEFLKHTLSLGIVEALKLFIDTLDLDDPEIPMSVKEALRSKKPYTGLLKEVDPFILTYGHLEEGDMEKAISESTSKYPKKESYALKREVFVEIFLNAIENQALKYGESKDIQEALAVFFHKKQPSKEAIEEYYTAYFGGPKISFECLEKPEIFDLDKYIRYRALVRDHPDHPYFLEVPADSRAQIALLDAEQGAFRPTSYRNVVSKTGASFANCVEESIINCLFFMIRKKHDDAIVYTSSILPEGSPARVFMDRYAIDSKKSISESRTEFSEILASAPGVTYVKKPYELRSGIISGMNALAYLLGLEIAPLEFDTYDDRLPEFLEALHAVLSDGMVIEPEEEVTKSKIKQEAYGDIELQNIEGEHITWKLSQGHGSIKVPSGAKSSWVDDLLSRGLTPDQAKMIIPLVSTKEQFNAIKDHIDPKNYRELYESIDLYNPDLTVEVIGHIASNLLKGDRQHLKFLGDLSEILDNLEDHEANYRASEFLAPVIIDADIEDEAKLFITRSFPYVLTDPKRGNTSNPVLEWVCENKKREFLDFEKRPYSISLDLSAKIIREHSEFLAEHIKDMPYGQVRFYIDEDDIEIEHIKTLAKAINPKIENLYLHGAPSLCKIVIDNLESADVLEDITFNFNAPRAEDISFDEKRNVFLAALTRNSDIELYPSYYLNRPEAKAMEEHFTAAGFRPRPYPDRWEPSEPAE